MTVISSSGEFKVNNDPVLRKVVSSLEWKYNNTDYPSLLFAAYTCVPDFDPITGEIAGNTGQSWDPVRKMFVISGYNYQFSSKLLFFKPSTLAMYPYTATGTTIPIPDYTIDLTALIDHIQGVAYNPNSKGFYVWGTIKGEPSADTNRIVIHVDDTPTGRLIESPWYPDFSVQAGMIAIYRNEIYFKANNTNTLLRKYNLRGMTLISEVTTFTTNEGLGIDWLNGNIIIGADGGAFKVYDRNMTELFSFSTTVAGGEVEGLIYLPNRLISICADRKIHGDRQNGNCVYLIDPLHEYDKTIYFGYQYDWSLGKFSGGTYQAGSEVFGTGTWESPVMDFGGYGSYFTNDPVVTSTGRTITFEYRGSATAPTVAVNTDETIPVYDANLSNDGWGATVPSAWSASKVGARYQQLRITIR